LGASRGFAEDSLDRWRDGQLPPSHGDGELQPRMGPKPAQGHSADSRSDPGAAIEERVRHKTVPLVLGNDTTPVAIRGALGMILPSSGFVDLVMVDAKDNETTSRVRTAVEQALYRLYRPMVSVYGL